MILNTKGPLLRQLKTLNRSVIQVQVSDVGSGVDEGSFFHSETVVLRRDLDTVCRCVFDWMVGAMMSKREFVCFCPYGQSQ